MLLSSSMTCSECNDRNQTHCQQHVDQHQRLLDEQLDWLTVDHDDLRQYILEQNSRPKYHPSMTVIDKWEQETVERIRHTAVLARRALLDALDQHVAEVKKTLNTLTPKLREARHRIKPFNGNDIQEWVTMLQKLKQIPVFPVTIDKDNNIHGITVDLRKQNRTQHSESKRDEPTSCSLVSIIRDPLPSTLMSDRTECQPIPTDLTKKTDIDNKKIKFDNISSNRSETITPGGVIIIREEQKEHKNETTILRIPRAHAEIPFDSKTSYSFRWPATIY